MYKLDQELISLGIIDRPLLSFKIEDWYNAVSISFLGRADIGEVFCRFDDCFEIEFKHDLNYKRIINLDGSRDYQYFIQNITILQEGEYFHCTISAWPFQGKIVCKSIDYYSATNKMWKHSQLS